MKNKRKKLLKNINSNAENDKLKNINRLSDEAFCVCQDKGKCFKDIEKNLQLTNETKDNLFHFKETVNKIYFLSVQ